MHAYAYILIVCKFHSVLAFMKKSQGSRWPAWAAAAIDAGYAQRHLAA